MAKYVIQVSNGGQPVAGAEVRILGVGIDDTGANGVAEIPVAGTKRLARGTRFAARIGKLAGLVDDEPDMLDLIVTVRVGGKEVYAGGHRVAVVPDVQTDIAI